MPTKTDITHIIDMYERGSTSSKSLIHCVSCKDDLSGKKIIHIASSGKSRKEEENTVKTNGAGKVHKNPASKPDQIYGLLIKLLNFLMTLLKR